MKCLQSCMVRSDLLVCSSPVILLPGLQRISRATGYGVGNCLFQPLFFPARVLARAFPPVHSSPSPGTFPRSPLLPPLLLPGPPHCRIRMHLYQPLPCDLVISYMTVYPFVCIYIPGQVHEQRHRVSL